MCGIIGYVGRKNAVSVLTEGLRALEYRGYDSAGIAVFDGDHVTCVKSGGRISDICARLDGEHAGLVSHCGIGHTRWATHGAPSDENAHPHFTEMVYAVHNGIIENDAVLRERMTAQGYHFRSETDTEAAVCLIDFYYRQLGEPRAAIFAAIRELRGSWALAVMFADRAGEIYATCHESPLVAAWNENGAFAASDVTAILDDADHYARLEENELAVLSAEGIRFYGTDGASVEKTLHPITWTKDAAHRGGFPHFMLKEIHEEPAVLRGTFGAMTRPVPDGILPSFSVDDDALSRAGHIHIAACGTAMHAGLIGGRWIEAFAGIPVSVEIASEFRYGNPIVRENDLFLAISQSGETADTLAALRLAKSLGLYTLAVVNVVGSSVAREADGVIYTCAGPEIAVASTKAYSVQLAALYLFASYLGILHGKTEPRGIAERLALFAEKVPGALDTMIQDADVFRRAAETLRPAENVFFIGRGTDYFLAEEASLKLKEISYIHSEAYPAGELKHGTISLIRDGTPVVAIATVRALYDKMISGIREVRARGAYVLLLCGADFPQPEHVADVVLRLPPLHEEFAPFAAAPAFQLLAYYTAVLRGCDVDKPRNLAKSVTVE